MNIWHVNYCRLQSSNLHYGKLKPRRASVHSLRMLHKPIILLCTKEPVSYSCHARWRFAVGQPTQAFIETLTRRNSFSFENHESNGLLFIKPE